ncbi:hypothetical protein SE00_07645 [Staphylococcus saprophyticus]|uniref:hypothetical protein n=1 Tax=Staphylococcus saprophyticus TaxID=29385 RepID=UPI000597768C|nr:hypothetical protein [Staphylococcus saprophyticus]KIJ86826.1 hypothetical protein SE00_07645 [Staphylococcus saprophyticus]
MDYKSCNKVESVRVDYLYFYEVYDEYYIEDLDNFAQSIDHHMNTNTYKVFEVDTLENERLIIDTTKIVNVRILYK